jgi:hypothetical protein
MTNNFNIQVWKNKYIYLLKEEEDDDFNVDLDPWSGLSSEFQELVDLVGEINANSLAKELRGKIDSPKDALPILSRNILNSEGVDMQLSKEDEERFHNAFITVLKNKEIDADDVDDFNYIARLRTSEEIARIETLKILNKNKENWEAWDVDKISNYLEENDPIIKKLTMYDSNNREFVWYKIDDSIGEWEDNNRHGDATPEKIKETFYKILNQKKDWIVDKGALYIIDEIEQYVKKELGLPGRFYIRNPDQIVYQWMRENGLRLSNSVIRSNQQNENKRLQKLAGIIKEEDDDFNITLSPWNDISAEYQNAIDKYGENTVNYLSRAYRNEYNSLEDAIKNLGKSIPKFSKFIEYKFKNLNIDLDDFFEMLDYFSEYDFNIENNLIPMFMGDWIDKKIGLDIGIEIFKNIINTKIGENIDDVIEQVGNTEPLKSHFRQMDTDPRDGLWDDLNEFLSEMVDVFDDYYLDKDSKIRKNES